MALPPRHPPPAIAADLSRGAAGSSHADNSSGRHCYHLGAFQHGAVPGSRLTLARDTYNARADDVFAHAKAPRRDTVALRFVLVGNRDPWRGAMSAADQGANDRMVGADHLRVLFRHRRPLPGILQ